MRRARVLQPPQRRCNPRVTPFLTPLACRRVSADRGVPFEKAAGLLAEQTAELAGFYKKANDASLYNVLLCLEKREHIATRRPQAFHIVRPNTGFRPEELSDFELRRTTYVKLSPEEGEQLWRRCHAYSEHSCGHKGQRSGSCKGADCVYRRRLAVRIPLLVQMCVVFDESCADEVRPGGGESVWLW